MNLQPDTGKKTQQNKVVFVAQWEGVYEFNYRSFDLSLRATPESKEDSLKLTLQIGAGRRAHVPHSHAHTKELNIAEALLFIAETATSCAPANPLPKTNVTAEFGQNQHTSLRTFLHQISKDGNSTTVDYPDFILAHRPSFTISTANEVEVSISPARRQVLDGYVFEFLLREEYTVGKALRTLNSERLIPISEAAELFQKFAEATLQR